MRAYNFSAGPATLPEEVLQQASTEMLNFNDHGMSVMEMSHRSKMYTDIHEEALTLLRELMAIPQNYKILFLQGGASQQFAIIPMNLSINKKADYIITGEFASKAYKDASKLLQVNIAATSEDRNFSYIPQTFNFSSDADYVHITYNNTMFGTRYISTPNTDGIPLVSDWSSGILSEVVDVSKFGLIYAGAQKNIGPSGLTVVIIREDLLNNENANDLPTIFQYKKHAEADSAFNTPPTYAIYTAGLCFKWLIKQGGVKGIQQINEEKAKVLYDFLDSSSLFKGIADEKYRSLMNVTFTTGDDTKDKEIVKAASKAGFLNLGGHRLVGGFRASIYNAMPKEGIKKLVDFLKGYENNV